MKKIKIFFILILTVFVLTGCISIKSTSGADGGIFKSEDKGENWSQKVLIPTVTGTPGNIAGTNITAISFDPQDNKAVYIGTEQDGLFYSYNGADSWFKAGGLPEGATVYDVSVDPKSKCTIYAAIGNSIYKSVDCNRTWSRIYFETDVTKKITQLEIDWFNPNTIYAGTSAGDVLKSNNAGQSWSPVYRLKREILGIEISRIDSRVVYVIAKAEGISKTTDGGLNWEDLRENLREFKNAVDVKKMAINKSKKEGQDDIILATAAGMFKSTDGAKTWSEVTLLTLTDIYSLAVNPKNFNEIYYGTATTFYRSTDGGQNWTTKKLPTSRSASFLAVNPENPDIVYMGVKKLEEAGFGL